MDHIIQALERANTSAPASPKLISRVRDHESKAPRKRPDLRTVDVEVGPAQLEKMRIVAHDPADPRTKAFDILRTQILQEMDGSGWRILAVTSPGPGCGKTFTALNLALSIARQPESAVLLVDLDLQKPQLAHRLGLKSSKGIRALLEERATLDEAITNLAAGGVPLGLLPCERATSRASDWTGSPQMSSVLQSLRTTRNSRVVILDLPPLLTGDETISVLPQVDCALLVAAAGTTKASEIKECANHLGSTPLLKLVFNKAPGTPAVYY